MSRRLIDMHCHILPGVDDGCKTMEEAVNSIKGAVEQGVQGMVVTPHFHPGRYMVPAHEVKAKLEELRVECKKQNIPIELYQGQECYYYSELGDKLDRGEALTLNGTNLVLLEFDPEVPFSMLEAGIRDIQSRGYRVVLAHFERYHCLEDTERLMRLKRQRVLLQTNYDTLRIKDRLFHKNPWRRAVQEGLVDYLGSDCHGTDFRPYHVDQALEWMDDKVDEDVIDDMLYRNMKRLGLD